MTTRFVRAGFFLVQPEDALAALITTWYAQHLAAGGARDAVADDLIAEARAEDAAGQAVFYVSAQNESARRLPITYAHIAPRSVITALSIPALGTIGFSLRFI